MKQALFLLAPVLATLAASQSVLTYGSGALPNCAKDCETLQQAAQGCVPAGGAPISSQATYDSCFCQSALLTSNLAAGSSTNPTTLCNSVCTATSEQKAIQKWYDSFCDSDSTTAAATTSGVASATSAAASATSTSVDGDAADATTESSGQRWWHSHARWIAMAIVLIVAFIFALVFGLFLKRRSTRKHQREAALAPPVVWGPHQNQHHTGGIAYGAPGSKAEKGKGRAMIGSMPTASSQPMDYSEKNGGKRLKKSLFGR